MSPLVSIIIPTGPAHQSLVATAVASCQWQSVAAWEAIVINDGPTPIAPFVDARVTVIDTGGGLGPATARNRGLAHAHAPFVIFLDADDYLLPDSLNRLLRFHVRHDRAYTYANHYAQHGESWGLVRPAQEYSQAFYERYNLHVVTALLPTATVREIGGFDEEVRGWEDWTLYLRLALAGQCGAHLADPIFVYQTTHSVQHHRDNAYGQALLEEIRERYRHNGRMEFMPCGCSAASAAAKQQIVLGGLPPVQEELMEALILEYTGAARGKQSFRVNGRTYSAGGAVASRYLSTANGLLPEDVPALLALGAFRQLPPPQAYVAPPAPAEQIAEAPAAPHATEAEPVVLDVASDVAIPTPTRRARAKGAA